ncbi:D-alanyl-D-alanine carboxypeptidase DacC precursor [Legionella massiliensis]|uniref:D-alanyl-D-alanine carboxypeptidase DacC n=1 Tax=Legionella massiliensis TaxID=1034943 RepID=A0A078KX31_9GAMM|nr:D-alanyl-D-alanine carboxypeptidase/D-alanyl-D-alanine-endopeptidase [Legionella massiliensis]CDZ76329.1 D-alanyl-D-alanine carboxypeptidase DacC precursor [Legionella massiliensis]CEE12067.1 D-alanyl-D-alanine carboxypeptidase DacC precursor [Legionella massiliensis]
MKIYPSFALALSLFPLFTSAAEPVFAIKAIGKAPQILVDKQQVLREYKVVNNSAVRLTNNHLVELPPGVRQITTGKGSCQNSFDLAPRASCRLILEINAATMNADIQGGPKICSAEDKSTCSLPATGDSLAFKKNEDLDAIFNKVKYQSATWGLQVIDQSTGALLIDLHSDRHFYVGSIRKLFSVGELLEQLGPNYQFNTPVSYQGSLDSKGVLKGDLILEASGDLAMGGRTLPDGSIAITDFDHNEANSLGNAILTSPDPLAGYKKLAQQVYSFGIRRISGNVVIDDRLFTPFNFRDEFQVSAIFVNDDVVDLIINPGSAEQLAEVKWRPISAAFTVLSNLKTTADKTEASYKLEPELLTCIGATPCQGRVTGNLPKDFIPPLTGKYPLVQTFRITKPANYARSVFIEALQQAGVTVDAPVVANNPSPPNGPKTAVTSLVSQPYSEYAKWILKVSYNIGADTSLVLWGVANGVKTMSETLELEKNRLTTQYHLPAKQFSFVDGSGGGETKLTNSVATQWLDIMAKSPVFQTFFDALPILGVDGSLATIKNFQSNPSLSEAIGKVRAKTGTYAIGTEKGLMLKGQGFAGYIDSKSGKRLIYQLVVNEVPIKSIDDILEVFQDEGTMSAILWRDF